jgi:hypothetical protein
MLLAAQMTFEWHRRYRNDPDQMREEYDFSNGVRGPVIKEETVETQDLTESPNNKWPFPAATVEKTEPVNPLEEKDFLKEAEGRIAQRVEQLEETPMPIDQWNKMIEEAEKEAEKEAERLRAEALAAEEAKKWAEENPQTEEADKAKEWAEEQTEEDSKKKELTWFEKEGKEQIKKTRPE